MLELKNVTRTYPSPKGADEVQVLDGVSLNVQEGISMAVVGPSGCGKSTLLNIIGALDKPTAGEVVFEGREYGQLGEPKLAELRRHEIGFVFQLHHLLPQCTVLENVLIPTIGDSGKTHAEKKARAVSLLERVGLSDFSEHNPGQLSGGQRQRVAVARALINQPKLLLADEPTGSLDMKTSGNIMDLLCGLNEDSGLTMIMVTHSMEHARRMRFIKRLENGGLFDSEG